MGHDDASDAPLVGSKFGELKKKKPTIVYATVACRDKAKSAQVVSDSFVSQTPENIPNLPQTIVSVMNKLPNEERAMYQWDAFKLCVKNEGSMQFLALVDDGFATVTSFAFLDQLQLCFQATFGQRDDFRAHECQQFDSTIKEEGIKYNTNPPTKGQQVKNQLEVVKDGILKNIEEVIERHQKIEVVAESCDELVTSSQKFSKSAKKLKYTAMWKNIKFWILIGIVVAAIILVILLIACNPNFSKCKSDD